MDAVRRTPAPGDLRVWNRRVFADLPVLGAQLREEWNLVPPDDRSAGSWTALNAFAARLTPDVLDLTTLGMWTIEAALRAPDQRPAAAQWFLHAGAQRWAGPRGHVG